MKRAKKSAAGRRTKLQVQRLGDAREALLKSAIRLLNDNGPGNVSLHDVAADAKVNVALVKYYFGSKDQLFQAVVKEIISVWGAQLAANVPSDGSPTEQLRARIKSTLEVHYLYPYLTRLIMQQMVNKPSAEGAYFLEEFTKRNFREHRDLLKSGEKSGEFRPVDPKLFFLTYIGMLDFLFVAGPFLKAILDVDKVDELLLTRFTDHATELLLHGIGK